MERRPYQGRRLCLFDEVGLAEGFEVGVFVGQLFQAVVEFDGPADVGVGGGEIAPLGGITAEIELDEGVLGVKGGGLREDFGGGIQGIAAAFGEGPGDEPAGLIGVGCGEFGRQGGSFRPLLGPLQQAEFELQNPRVPGHGWGKQFKFSQGVRNHPEVGIANGTFRMPEIFP